MSESLSAQPGFAVEAAFADRPGEVPAEPVRRRVRPSGRVLVALAGASLLPWTVDVLARGGGGAWFWGLFFGFFGTALLPLAVPREPAFRNACLVVGWCQFGLEAVCSAPYFFLSLPVIVFGVPTGVMLLLTARQNRGTLGTVLAVLVGAGPIGLLAHGGWTHM
ncbi:hypothetical protein ABTY61_14385 [Kitasatospora sp. NPDC096128]|uniref:hypothetical protein n=1 Tax=Kitasatospora sp. NPDC096128 TaxID=3155547 RepID=UPI00331883C4